MYSKFFIVSIIITFSLSLLSLAGNEPEYVGANKCKTCHKAEKNGQQFKIWSNTKHAQAYEDLKTENAKKKAKIAGVSDPLKDEKCLSCHSTAYGKKNHGKSYKIEEGVTCEACHGPGSEYKKTKVMKDKKSAIAAGLLEATKETCKQCHKADNPGHEGKFTTFEKEFAKIAHPVPPENDRRKKKK